MPVLVEIRSRDGEARTEEFDGNEIRIGRVPGNDIVLPRGNITKYHARLVRKDGKLIIVDLKSTNGTYVNGRKITSPLVIPETDTIYVGDFMLKFEEVEEAFDGDTLEVDVTELRLLAGVAQHEDGSRLVYADWLEQQGDPVRAEFLRIQETIPRLAEGTDFTVLSHRMRELAAAIDIDWRRKVARPLIENCLGFELECPRDWGSLSATERSTVRYCDSCRKQVYYCSTVAQARTHAMRGDCVAVDLVQIRRPHDLQRDPDRPVRMGMIMPHDDD